MSAVFSLEKTADTYFLTRGVAFLLVGALGVGFATGLTVDLMTADLGVALAAVLGVAGLFGDGTGTFLAMWP